MIGNGLATRLNRHGLFTMGDIARCSLDNEEMLYREFGINARFIIDQAWGYEPVTIADIKAYRPDSTSLSTGQVLTRPYSFEETRIIVREMTEGRILDLVRKGFVTDQLVLHLGYDIENVSGRGFSGEIVTDRYGRKIPRHAHGTANLGRHSSSTKLITEAVMELFDRIADENLLVRRLTLSANHVLFEADVPREETPEQFDLFTDYEALEKQRESEKAELEREKRRQQALLYVKKRYGKNAILKGMNFEEGATARDRNSQIGGHKA